MEREFTGHYDDEFNPIFLGDKLISDIGCEVIVVPERQNYVGLIIFDNDICIKDNIPCHLNNGKGFKVANNV